MPNITITIPSAAVPFMQDVVDRYNTRNGTSWTQRQFITRHIKALMRDERIRQFKETDDAVSQEALNQVSLDSSQRINEEVIRIEGIVGL